MSLCPPVRVQAHRLYYQQQRATMTRKHVFTWGGRLPWHGPKHATGFQCVPAGLRREPLRLDRANADD